MELGKHLRELFRFRVPAVVCILLGILAAVWASYQIQLFPPGISPRSIEIASASTEVLVDTPFSSAVDLRQGRGNFEAMTSRATAESFVASMAFAWNPSLPGAKIEDTVLCDANGLEILTIDPAWPTFERAGRQRPYFLVRP